MLWVSQSAVHHIHQHVRLGACPKRPLGVNHLALCLLTMLVYYSYYYYIDDECFYCSHYCDTACAMNRSMVRAVDGMVKEKDAIFVTLLMTVVCFQFIALSCAFIVMEDNCAYVATVVLLVGTYYWYKYCLRIYNRFKIHHVQFAWKEEMEGPRAKESSNNNGRSGRPINTINPKPVDPVWKLYI